MIYLKLFLTAVFWGGTFIAGRVVAESIDPYSAAFLRFLSASILLLVILFKVEKRLPRLTGLQYLAMFILGMSGVFAYNIFFFSGLKEVTAGRASVIIATNPILISIFAAVVFKEKLTVQKIIGILISVAGAIIVITRGNLGTLSSESVGWGEFYIFMCVVCWVTYSIIGKAVLSNVSPLISVTYSSIIGTVLLFVPVGINHLYNDFSTISIKGWSSIVYLAVFGTVIGFIWYYQGLKEIGPTKASIFINFVPISAIILAFIILGENITDSLFFGALMVISGVYLVNRKTRNFGLKK